MMRTDATAPLLEIRSAFSVQSYVRSVHALSSLAGEIMSSFVRVRSQKEHPMSDTKSQFSEQPIPPQQSSSQFSDEPLPPKGPALDALAAPPSVQRRLRLWPGVVIIAIQWAVVTGIGQLFPATPVQFMAMFIGPMAGALAILIWWLFFSRLSWPDRLIVPVACALFGASIMVLGHDSIGMFGILLYGLPAALTAWIAWLVVSYPLSWPVRRAGLALVFMLTWGYFTLLRMDGVWGGMTATLNWRWVPTKEQDFLADRIVPVLSKTLEKDAKPLVLQEGDWPCFRGPNRDNRLIGVKVPTDWDKNPPKLLWRHKVGPGWGSFAVVGKHLYTQEQWDQNEAVVCYDADTGKVIWFHEDKARFTETVAGPGPRATPTFHDGKLYTMGAAGKLCCLDAGTGKEIWSRDILVDSDAKVPTWGFAASPLIVQGIVMVFAGGPNKSVVGYDAATGKFAWAAGEGKLSYCSLQRATIGGVEQALLASDGGLTAFEPKAGKVLWDHKWPFDGPRCIQPADLGNADFLVGSGFGNGTRRLHITKDNDQWDNKELWTTRAISPYFNDFVVHRDHLYGFNTEIFTCVSLDKGKAKWKERGYGCGQVLLLADQDLLLIVSEKGEAALVEANPTEHKELARFQAIEGKTWNHPVVAHGRLYVRNGEEAACYQLGEAKQQVAR
jgi:outer membrane protein assembly factor BamB